MKETAENVDEAVRELPDANKVTFEVLEINGAYDLISNLLHMIHMPQPVVKCAETRGFVGKPFESGSSKTP